MTHGNAGRDMDRETPAVSEEACWRRELMPLPHEVRIEKIQRLRPGEVAVRGRSGASGLEQACVDRARDLFGQKTGVSPEGGGFEIRIGLVDEDGKLEGVDVPHAARLQGVPNRDQAYVIQPIGENVLAVAALADRGLYYGTCTLTQWLDRHLTRDLAEIPMATVVDWPDLEERGFWHLPVSLIPWMASMKMNRFFVSHRFEVDEAGIHLCSGYNEPDDQLRQEWTPPYDKARMHAAEAVPGPTHMDFWESRCKGYREAFPHVLGKGDAARDPFITDRVQRVPCTSHPDVVKVLTAVMADLAAQNASEVMVWVSEYPHAYCGCAKCMEQGQFRGEVRCAIEA